jgi:CRP-like cAMP-binding protein
MRVVTLWDVLGLDLGEDPQLSIPLFRGLRKSQARIVALMMDIQTYPKGHPLFRVGDPGDEAFVVLDGELQISLPREGRSHEVGTVRRGDVVGEVALFHGVRSADVEALSEVRLLRLEEDDLARLRRRYPRIGAQVLTNLSRILADRLAAANRERGR